MANKTKPLLSSYKRFTIVPALVISGVSVLAVVLISLYLYTHLLGFFIAFAVVTFITLAAYIAFHIFLFKNLKTTYYEQLFETTFKNITKLKNNDVNLLSYGESDIKEIQMLEKATNDIKTKFESSYLLLKVADYSKINLEYVDKEKSLISYKSFRENIANIIFVSQSFRNVVIEVYFDMPGTNVLTKKDKTRLLKLYRETFKEHENVLYMFGEDDKSLIIYVPVIDSFAEIKEKLNMVVTSSSVMVRDDRGIQNILARYALVAYPYSNEEMILGDLKYAKRQNKPYNLYLPTRHKSNVGAKLLINTSMNLNYTSKILTELSHLDYSAVNNEKNDAILNGIFDAIANFLDVDDVGIIAYNDTMDDYYSYVSSKRSSLFIKHKIDKEFVENLGSVVDEDEVYYFSTKKHANMALQQSLGLYGIESGIYYVIRDFESNKISAIIYMFNRNRDMILNTYLRETFFIVSLRIENYFEKREIADYADAKATENENILALANMFVYHIDDDYNITYLSRGIKRVFKNIELGEKCYHAMFGHEKRCQDCPLVSKKKKYFEINGSKFETSTSLSDRKDNDQVVLIKRITEDEVVGDLYQEDFLTYSFKSLVNTIRNEYSQGGRGYMILLSVDNYEEIIQKIGSEGYNYLIRDYVRNLKNKLQIEDIYFYNPSTLAIHLPFDGHRDIINKIELIYPLSKQQYYNNKDFSPLNISYLPTGYPRGYAAAEDYLKHMSDFYHDPSFERNKDFIYFSDYSISRSASKRDFMISVLQSEFSGHNSTSMNLQPIVRVKDGHIYGAEILLRIADAHRNVFFNAEEISRLAEQENMTGMVTESIINFIGAMYKEYGNNIFKINKFNRIAINIDQTYLDNKDLLTKLIALCEENNLPNGFISMEIPEDVVPNNKEKIRDLAKELSKYKIMFSCDRYMGQYLNVEELQALGFNEVKIARDIILAIDRDQVKYSSLKSIVDDAKEHDMALAAVGVENEQQFKLLKELDEEMVVQGYFLYKPLTRADLITALISYEK